MNQHTESFESYFATERDAHEYQLKMLLSVLLLYACFAAYVFEWLGFWWMAGISSVIATRWMIAFHELFHLKSADQLDWITRLVPIPFSPINLGYREYRQIHFAHHKHTATPADPDAFHILGGFFRAFLGALTQHEQASFRYIMQHGLNRELAISMTLRLLIFVMLLSLAPVQFLLWAAVLRVTYTINDFVFFHLVHYRFGQPGTFRTPLPAILRWPLILVYGFDVVYATMYHDIHHAQPRIAPRFLPLVAKGL